MVFLLLNVYGSGMNVSRFLANILVSFYAGASFQLKILYSYHFFHSILVLSQLYRAYWYCHSCTVHIGTVTVVPCILIPSKSFIYQLMHNRVALKEY